MVIPIDDSHVLEIQNIAVAINVNPFKGTFKIYQVIWSISQPTILHAKRLSCIVCAANTKCPHFEMGIIPVQSIQLPKTTSSSTSEAGIASKATSSTRTSSASTITGPGKPRLFMETLSPDPLLNLRQPLTTNKRFNFEDIYSDDSASVSPNKIFRSVKLDDSENSHLLKEANHV